MMDIDYFDRLPEVLRRWLQESDIVGGLRAQEVYLLNQVYGPGKTLVLLQAREAMEKARRPQCDATGATLAQGKRGSGAIPQHAIRHGMKKDSP